jgi:glycerate 2-kinase
MDQAAQMRQAAREIFQHAVAQSLVPAAFARNVQVSRGVMRICDDLFELSGYGRIFAVAVGKAAAPMVEELAKQLGTLLSGIVAAPEDALRGRPQVSGFRYFAAGHPLPNAESVRAADAVLKALPTLPPRSLVIFLLSGGGSSLMERPLDAEISLDDLIATYRALVLSGAPIAEINTVRKHLSAVKGGRLAQAAAKCPNAQQVSIMISDVPDDALDSLSSGPSMPDSRSVEDCYGIVAKYGLLPHLPASVRDLLETRALEETPDKDDPIFHNCRWWPVLTNASAVRAAAAKASELGFAVEVDSSCDDQDYAVAADYLLDRVRKLHEGASRVCLISGGEVTVRVPAQCGTGGRNQQFALYSAGKIASENICVLSAGTDGIDGNSPAAGAVADGTTLLRHSARGEGSSLSEALKRFDATPFFHALGDDIVTGPTGTNVRDLRILLAY